MFQFSNDHLCGEVIKNKCQQLLYQDIWVRILGGLDEGWGNKVENCQTKGQTVQESEKVGTIITVRKPSV